MTDSKVKSSVTEGDIVEVVSAGVRPTRTEDIGKNGSVIKIDKYQIAYVSVGPPDRLVVFANLCDLRKVAP